LGELPSYEMGSNELQQAQGPPKGIGKYNPIQSNYKKDPKKNTGIAM
jgi:hypothetical protein